MITPEHFHLNVIPKESFAIQDDHWKQKSFPDLRQGRLPE